MSTPALLSAIQVVIALAFIAAALGATSRWIERRGAGNGWAAAAFLALSAVSLYQFVPGREPGPVEQWLTAAIGVFLPYFLLRFGASLASIRPLVRDAASALTLVLIAATGVLPAIPSSSPWLFVYIAALLTQWMVWPGLAAVKLWRLGDGAASVPRRRVRLLSTAIAALAVAVALSTLLPAEAVVAQVIAHLLTLLSGIAFYVGIAPPRIIRVLWREREQARLHATIETLLTSPTVTALVSDFLPQAAELVGADALALLDENGVETAACPADFTGPSPRQRVFQVELPRGAQLRVVAGAASPHFGRDELELLRSVGSLAVLSIERTRLHEEADEAKAEADRANRAKSEFLSRMSHELRTPMTSIMGFGLLLERELSDPQQVESLGYIRKASKHLLDLINEVLDISRIEADRMALSVEPVHVSEVVTECAELVFPMAESRSITVTLEPSDTSAWVAADRQRLKQVLLNLLSNAVKYNRDAGEVHVSWRGGPEITEIAVRDTGPGIPADRLDRLFEPFDRLGAESSDVEGTGLGLALSKRLVETMHGRISVSSSHRGSTFVATLPSAAAPVAPEEAIDLNATADAATPDEEAIVLYVEDNPANVALIGRVLGQRPHVTLLTAMQGSLGLEIARDHQPDLILLDLHLPDMSGDDLLARLKGDETCSDIPVIMVSADATPGRARQMIEAGAAEYITKPIDIDGFLDAVDRFLSSSDVPAGSGAVVT